MTEIYSSYSDYTDYDSVKALDNILDTIVYTDPFKDRLEKVGAVYLGFFGNSKYDTEFCDDLVELFTLSTRTSRIIATDPNKKIVRTIIQFMLREAKHTQYGSSHLWEGQFNGHYFMLGSQFGTFNNTTFVIRRMTPWSDCHHS